MRVNFVQVSIWGSLRVSRRSIFRARRNGNAEDAEDYILKKIAAAAFSGRKMHKDSRVCYYDFRTSLLGSRKISRHSDTSVTGNRSIK